MKSLKKLRKYDRYSSDDLKSLEHDKLLSVLSHAINSSEFYNNLKISPIDNAYSLLKKFPILEKKTIREHAQGLCTSKNNLIARKSSGSSGFQTTVYINKEEESLQRAYQVHWWEWAGYKIGMPILQTGITPKRRFIKKIKDYLLNTYYLKAFTHDEDSLSKALLWARKQKKVFLGGYASSLYVISQHVNNKKIEASFSGAVSWGDKLFPHYKKNIEKYLNVNVCETYGSSEGFLIAAQKDLQYMYIMSAHVYLEIVDDEGNEVPDGELGHVLVTSLDAYTMPLIRYRIGDLAIKLPRDKYPKKRELAYPLLEKIIGQIGRAHV